MVPDRWRQVREPVAAAILGVAMILTVNASALAEEPATVQNAQAASAADRGECSEIVALLASQEEKNSREFRQIKRDIAALSQQVEKPGMNEILGGIGYIVGLFGVAAYVASRRRAGDGGR